MENGEEKAPLNTAGVAMQHIQIDKNDDSDDHHNYPNLQNVTKKGILLDDADTDMDDYTYDDTEDDSPRSRSNSLTSYTFHGLRACYHPNVYRTNWKHLLNEIISGFIVAFAQVPESIAFALLAGVPPIIGLHSAWLIGGIVSFFGGRPGMISGATGGIGAVLTAFMLDDNIGLNYLPFIIILAGVLIVFLALCNVSKLGRLIPETVMIGFVNGLAIIIGMSQFHIFGHTHSIAEVLWVIFLTFLTFCIVEFLPKLTSIIPSSLAGIGMCTAVEYVIIRLAVGHSTPLIGDLGEISGGIPKPIWNNSLYELPKLDAATFNKIITPSILITLVSITEDLLTIDVVAELSKTRQLLRQTKQQLVAMGSANIIGGILGTMGGHATIGLSMINCHTGSNGKFRISGCIASLLVLIIILAASPALEAIPASALVGVMCVVVYHTFEWHSLVIIFMSMCPAAARKRFPAQNKINRGDAFVIVLVTVMTLVTNLAYAVISGILFSALLYTWTSGFDLKIEKEYIRIVDIHNLKSSSNPSLRNLLAGTKAKRADGVEEDYEVQKLKVMKKRNGCNRMAVYHLDGPLFFGNCGILSAQFTPGTDPNIVEIHLKDANIYDYSAMQTLNIIAEKYKKLDKTVHLRHINIKSHKLIAKADNLVKHFTYEDVIEAKDVGEVVLAAPAHLHVTQFTSAV